MTENDIKVVSFDIFQTLVDVNKRIPQIWAGILGEAYSEQMAALGADAILEIFPDTFEKAVLSNAFCTMQQVYHECAQKAIQKTGYAVTPESVVYHLLFQHSQSPFYDDVKACVDALCGRFRIVLCSDSDHLMTDTLIGKMPHEYAFISDDLNSYKGGPDGKFFSCVLEKLCVEPDEMLHIGDGTGDIVGAHRAGIRTCWLNRNAAGWTHPIKPDYTIHSLCELEDILLLHEAAEAGR